MANLPWDHIPVLPTGVASALNVSQSVRRRVSGPRTSEIDPSHSSDRTDDGRRYANPFEDAHKVVQQQKLPALGRELFSDDEDVARGLPPTTSDISYKDRPLPQLPVKASQDNYPSCIHGGTITRLPTPNFAAIRESDQRAHDIEGRLGLFFKLTQPFRMLGARSRPGDIIGGKADDDAGPSHSPTPPEGQEIGTVGTAYSRSPTLKHIPQSISLFSGDASESIQTRASAQSVSPNSATVKLVNGPLSRRTTKSTDFLDIPAQGNDDEDKIESGANSSTEALLSRQPPHSPALVAATHTATDRFTRRFPISVPYQKANGTNGDSDDQHILALLGYGETGAIVEWPNVWTPEKWSLLFSVCSVFAYGLAGLLVVLAIWFGVLDQSIMLRIIDYDILVTITSASLIVLGTSLFGICGTLLNSRPLLATYCFLLWPSFIGMLVVGYSAYRRAAFALPNKLDQAWSQKWGNEDRIILQYSLRCCGYWSPEHEAILSPLCFPRAMLPGCKARLLHFERISLKRYYTWIFALVPLHILNIVTAILCSNHVNRLFGKGLTPRQYRLSIADVRANALGILETYRETLIPPQPGRVYALRSRRFGDGTSRSPRIPQGDGSPQLQATREGSHWSGRLAYEDSARSVFGFRGERAKEKDVEKIS